MDFLRIDSYLRENLNEFRYNHTLRVVEMGEVLCDKFSYKYVDKVRAACYLHDSGKNIGSKKILELTLKEGYILNDYEVNNIHIFHGVASMVIARDKFNIYDYEILDAIRFHVTGRENMTIIDKIVFLADFFELGRDYERVYKSRDAALEDGDLNKSLVLAYNSIINDLISENRFIHEDTIKARNFLLMNK